MAAESTSGAKMRLLRPALALLCLALGPVAAWADSGTLMSRLAVEPKYDTSYDVYRKQKTWRQALKLDRAIRRARLRTELNLQFKEDKSRNNLEEAKNNLRLQLSRQIGLANLFADARLGRSWKGTTSSLRAINRNTVDFGSTLELLARNMASVSMSLRGGFTGRTDINERIRTTSVTRDTTDATGWIGRMGLNGMLDPNKDFSFQGDFSYSAGNQDSRSTHTETDADTSTVEIVSATDNDHALGYGFTGRWTGQEAFMVDLRSTYSNATSQYYQASEKTQETELKLNRATELLIEGQATGALQYGMSLGSTSARTDYDIRERDVYRQSTDFSINGRHELGIPLLAGSVVRASLSLGSARNETQNSSGFDTKRKQLSGEIAREFAERVKLSARTRVSLNQDYYDDGMQDTDRLRSETTVAGHYNPSLAFKANMSYTMSTEETVKIPARYSLQNQKGKDYKIAARYNADLPWGIKAGQSFQVSARYKYYVFDENKNTLTRTNRVTSGIDAAFCDRSALTLEHIFNRTDNGAYTYAGSGSGRSYKKSQERLRQYLKAQIRYDAWEYLYFKGTSTYDITCRTTLATDTTTRRDKRTLRGEVGFHKRFHSGLDVNATFAKVSSTQEDDYWKINAKVGMKFK